MPGKDRGIGFQPVEFAPVNDIPAERAVRTLTGKMPIPRPGTTPGDSRVPRANRLPQLVSRGRARQVQAEMLDRWGASVDWNGDGTLDLLRGMTNHVQVFDRAFLDNNLPTATAGKLETKVARP